MQIMQVRPSHPDSYERVCHDTGLSAFMLPLREPEAQFDEYIYFDETHAVVASDRHPEPGVPETYPFGPRGARSPNYESR